MSEFSHTWRCRARRVIVRVLEELPVGVDLKTKRTALRQAYPFGERRGWPYKVWLVEVRLQLAIDAPQSQGEPILDSPGQLHLFP